MLGSTVGSLAGLYGNALGQQSQDSWSQANQQSRQTLYGQSLADQFAQSTAPLTRTTQKERTLFQEIKNDVSTFIKEHRGVIYFVALALLIDHFVFKGVFKARLQAMLESLIAKVETKVSEAK